MRYLFRGLIRDNGSPVEGHVEAPTEEGAYEALAGNGVVTESLTPDPKPLNLNEELPTSPEFANALESAFDSSSSQVDFDALTQRYHGKKVWVIDRDKIRRRVAQVVDAALALSAQHGEGAGKARERVQSALTAMFADNRNLASERNAESVAGMRLGDSAAAMRFAPGDSVSGVRFNAPLPPAPGAAAIAPAGGTANGHPALENQIARLANLVKQAEMTLAAVSTAARRIGEGGGGGGPRRRSISTGGKGQEQNAVLLEIFKSNLDLVRGMQDGTGAGANVSSAGETAGSDTASQAPQPSLSNSIDDNTAESVGEPGSEIPAHDDISTDQAAYDEPAPLTRLRHCQPASMKSPALKIFRNI